MTACPKFFDTETEHFSFNEFLPHTVEQEHILPKNLGYFFDIKAQYEVLGTNYLKKVPRKVQSGFDTLEDAVLFLIDDNDYFEEIQENIENSPRICIMYFPEREEYDIRRGTNIWPVCTLQSKNQPAHKGCVMFYFNDIEHVKRVKQNFDVSSMSCHTRSLSNEEMKEYKYSAHVEHEITEDLY